MKAAFSIDMQDLYRSFNLLWNASAVALSVARPNKNIAATKQDATVDITDKRFFSFEFQCDFGYILRWPHEPA